MQKISPEEVSNIVNEIKPYLSTEKEIGKDVRMHVEQMGTTRLKRRILGN